MAIWDGSSPTRIALPGLLVAVLIGVTVPELSLTTYAVFPSGVIAMATGEPLTGMGLPAVLVAVLIGVTASGDLRLELATYTVLPSGVIAIALGTKPPTLIGLPLVLVA